MSSRKVLDYWTKFFALHFFDNTDLKLFRSLQLFNYHDIHLRLE